MIENVIGILKVWIITKALVNPMAWIGILILFSVINLILAIFVKFKNGFVSLASFIVFEFLGVVALVALLSNSLFRDNLVLGEGVVQTINDVSSKGLVYKKRFRTVTEPLLGIELPDEKTPYFTKAKEYILNARFPDSLHVYRSSAYTGVVIYDSEFNSINEQLLYDGLARTAKITPKQYSRIQSGAIKAKRGMWEVATAPEQESVAILQYSAIWIVFILSLCTSVALTTWLKGIVKTYAQ